MKKAAKSVTYQKYSGAKMHESAASKENIERKKKRMAISGESIEMKEK